MVVLKQSGGFESLCVTSVEVVAAVVVVNGLKQYDDNGVTVEVIKDLYH